MYRRIIYQALSLHMQSLQGVRAFYANNIASCAFTPAPSKPGLRQIAEALLTSKASMFCP